MSGEEIRFIRNGEEVKFVVDEKVDNDLKRKDKKIFKNIFEAIANSDGDKRLSAEEMEMVKQLKTIFEKTGDNHKSGGAISLDNEDLKIAQEFDPTKMNIKDFINQKLDALGIKKVTAAEPVEEVVENNETSASETVVEETVVVVEKPDEQNDSKAQTVVKKEVTQADKNKQFNAAMQNLAEKKFGAQKDELTQKFTKEVEVNKPLYTIAKEALKDELGKEPSMKEINDRIAQIALVNGIKDVNNIPRGKKIKVGTGTTAPVQGQETPVQGQGEVPTKGRETGTVPVEKPTGGLDVKPDTDVKNWTMQEQVPAIDDFTKPDGAEIEYYAGMVDGKPEDKYVYKQDGVTFEANDQAELKAKAKVLNDALAEFTKTVENETAEAKQTRFQGAIDALIGLGTESAVKKAQEKLAENKANVAADYYAEKTAAMIKSGNPALIEQMLGTDGAKFAETVNNSPVVQEAIGAVLKSLVDKFNNDEYLTLDEQRIKAVLDKCVDKAGVTVEAKPAQAAQAATETTPAKEATPEVVAKTLVTDKEGNSYYKAALTEDGAFKDVEFRAKDSEQLNEFMIKLKAATTDEAKTALFKEFAEKPNVDSELLKSMVKEAPKFKAGADVVLKLVENANLDLIYAMDTSHFVDVEANKDAGVAASQDKTNVQNAIKARIEAIMADETLRALPENAKYLDKIKGVDIAGQQTTFTKATDISAWGDPTVTKYVKTADGYAQAAEGATDTVDVKAYTKDGKTVYQVESRVAGVAVTLEADSAENVLKQKQDLEALIITAYDPELTDTDGADIKAQNLVNFIEMVKSPQNKSVLTRIATCLYQDYFIDRNAPEAKALVQKLLLTRDAEVVRALVEYSDGSINNTLFENDPVALKTLAAMFKEIRDKEKLPDPYNKLTPEQIALKDVLDDLVVNMGANIDNGNVLRFDGEGNLAVHNEDWSGNNDGAVAANSTLAEQYHYEKLMNDPILSKDKQALATWLTTYNTITKDVAKKLFSLENKTVDAELLSYIDFDNLDSDMSAEDKKAVQEAYVEKAKAVFENMGTDPASARYLDTIVGKISSFNEPGEDGVDADKVVIDEILSQFFVTTGEGENAVTTIKNFRRFTYEEMRGLAHVLSIHGTDAQKAALANMITPEEMEDGHFVRAIENSLSSDVVKTKYEAFINDMTTKEELIEFLKKMGNIDFAFPVNKIMEKFGDDAEVQRILMLNFHPNWDLSSANREKLLKTCMQVDASGNYSFDKTKLPEDVGVDNVIYMMPHDCTKGEAAKMFKAVLMTLDLSDENLLELVQCSYKMDQEIADYLAKFVDSEEVKTGDHYGNRYVNYMMSKFSYESSSGFYEKLYNNVTPAKKADLINNGFARDEHVCVQSGDSIDKIVKNYLKNNLDKFPRLKESVDNDTDRSKWTDARIEEALNDYMQEFRTAILNDLGITDPTKLREGDIIELDKIKWDEHQPGWWKYNFTY